MINEFKKKDKKIEVSETVTKEYSLEYIEERIKDADEFIVSKNEEKAQWESLKVEAKKLGL